ncbi:DegV family protein [Flexilinea flocculi]|uniref:EDD domain protein, DegV family n=1 Tax=Flexilinea flocculi TaxID=1678840 RepID=A0A0S7BJE5_9CHLR|nr:DegV family protein [Flexilinea flocculi]GAP40461.1 EDD domain protein, DegV family [Flexilinea flocculi]
MTVRIVTDSTCDLPVEIIKSLKICVVPLYVRIGNHDFLDGIDISREEFYEKMLFYEDYPTTAVPSPTKFRSLYQTLYDEGASEVLSIHISTSLSGVMDIAQSAAKDTLVVPVTVLDSQSLSMGTGFLVQKAAQLAQEGRTVKEILPVLEDQIQRTHVWAALDSMKYLRKSGRMNRFVSTIGDLLQIKPILKMHQGISGIEKQRTKKNAIQHLIYKIESLNPFEKLALLYSGSRDQLQLLQSRVTGLFPEKEILFGIVNPVLGAHLGSGVLGFACVQKET